MPKVRSEPRVRSESGLDPDVASISNRRYLKRAKGCNSATVLTATLGDSLLRLNLDPIT